MSQYLSNQFLIAMPSLMDPNFRRSVTLICEHNEEGALGIIINRPAPLSVGELLQQLGHRDLDARLFQQSVFHGGPVHPERGFVIHDGERQWESSLRLSPDLVVTTSRDILSAIAAGQGPKRSLIALGYAGWGDGQLDEEMRENSWLSCPADVEIIFDTAPDERWEAAAALIGIDLSLLSTHVGHA